MKSSSKSFVSALSVQPVKPQEFQFSPWTFTTCKSHILQSYCTTPSTCLCDMNGAGDGPDSNPSWCTFCRYIHLLTLPSLPEMLFGDNFIRIQHAKGFGIEFNPLDALRLVDDKHDLMKVAASKAWKEARSDSEHIKEVVKPFDWTYTTAYTGTLIGTEDKMTVVATSETIDIEKLKAREKILFYEDIHLFEDELADNGCALCSVKIRVMPNSFFVLLRFYLRVDNVLIRINDTRLYHEIDKDYMLREYSSRESPVSELQVSPSIYTDPNEIWQHLKLTEECKEKLQFPT